MPCSVVPQLLRQVRWNFYEYRVDPANRYVMISYNCIDNHVPIQTPITAHDRFAVWVRTSAFSSRIALVASLQL
jgi:hypothetical protein